MKKFGGKGGAHLPLYEDDAEHVMGEDKMSCSRDWLIGRDDSTFYLKYGRQTQENQAIGARAAYP